MFKNSKEILDYIKKEDVKLVDIRFIDLPGIQHHFNVPAGSFDESVFTDGLMFDGSSIRGFQSIHESDMKLLPIPSSAYLDPYRKEKTLIILFSVHNPIDNTPYSRDPRGVLTKAVGYLKSTGIADQAFFAPEAEFYIFDAIRFKTDMHEALILTKVGGTVAKSSMQMAHHLADIAHELRVDTSQFLQQISLQIFATKSLCN
jgi:glutamine synthetase